MASLAPTIATIATTAATAKTAFDTIGMLTNQMGGGKKDSGQTALVLQQLRERQMQAEQIQAERNERQKEQAALEVKQSEQLRKAALKRAMSRQTADFGARGISSTGGSSDAVLLGLFEESEAERKRREELDTIKSKALDSNLETLKKQNLLDYQQNVNQYRLAGLI